MFMAIQRELLPHHLSVADLLWRGEITGTLETRHIPAATVIKTGTLRDVSALVESCPRDRGLVWLPSSTAVRMWKVCGLGKTSFFFFEAIASGTRTPRRFNSHPVSSNSGQLCI